MNQLNKLIHITLCLTYLMISPVMFSQSSELLSWLDGDIEDSTILQMSEDSISVTSIEYGELYLGQEDSIKVDNLIGTWKLDEERIGLNSACFKLTKRKFFSFVCNDENNPANLTCPVNIDGNEILIYCHRLEQTKYIVRSVTKDVMIIDVYFLKLNGKWKRHDRKVRYVRVSQ